LFNGVLRFVDQVGGEGRKILDAIIKLVLINQLKIAIVQPHLAWGCDLG